MLADPEALSVGVNALAAPFVGERVNCVAAVEARGFAFGVAVAERLGVGFVPIRKPGKLPAKTTGVEYTLEYGTGRLEMHIDAFLPGSRVLVVDDVLATGGTASAACELIQRADGEVAGCTFLIELLFLRGRERLPGHRVETLVSYA